MKEVLLRKLIERGFVAIGSEMDVRYKGIDLSGRAINYFQQTCTILKIMETRKTKRVLIDVATTDDGSRFRVDVGAITLIEGMTPERFGMNYLIDEDGEEISQTAKRRGRRPKNWTPEMEYDYM